MKRWWCVLVSVAFAFVPSSAPSAEPFVVFSPSSFLEQAAQSFVPVPRAAVPSAPVLKSRIPEAESGLFDSAPNWRLTPGVLCTPDDKDFDQYRYPEQIAHCERNTSTADKKEVSRRYGIAWEDHSLYQYDHLLSLCLGGSNDLRNLWPMPYADARAKAKLEAALCRQLAKGEVTQAEAVEAEIGWFAENAPGMLPVLLGKGL